MPGNVTRTPQGGPTASIPCCTQVGPAASKWLFFLGLTRTHSPQVSVVKRHHTGQQSQTPSPGHTRAPTRASMQHTSHNWVDADVKPTVSHTVPWKRKRAYGRQVQCAKICVVLLHLHCMLPTFHHDQCLAHSTLAHTRILSVGAKALLRVRGNTISSGSLIDYCHHEQVKRQYEMKSTTHCANQLQMAQLGSVQKKKEEGEDVFPPKCFAQCNALIYMNCRIKAGERGGCRWQSRCWGTIPTMTRRATHQSAARC